MRPQATPVRNDRAPLPTDARAAARFDAHLHRLHPDAPRVDATRLQALADWLLGLDPAQARRELQQRLARVRELRRMAQDAAWDIDVAQRARLDGLLAYLDTTHERVDARVDGASVPGIGRLDDALLVELAWPAFADEVEDYLDFCRFRREQHPRGAPPLTRSDWCRMREGHGALWQQLQRGGDASSHA